MKSCPFCAEEIQDSAIRCKHCGGDLAAHAANNQNKIANQKAKASSAKLSRFGTLLLVIFGAISGFVMLEMWGHGHTIVQQLAAAAISAILCPLAWKIGNWYGKLGQADIILTTGDLASARIGNYLKPLSASIVATFFTLGSVSYMVNELASSGSKVSVPAQVQPIAAAPSVVPAPEAQTPAPAQVQPIAAAPSAVPAPEAQTPAPAQVQPIAAAPSAVPAPDPVSTSNSIRFYCADSKNFYPTVSTCPTPWIKVIQ